jgi:8-oxo-dGTP pyrophosphatase MutT (NUDIX family)
MKGRPPEAAARREVLEEAGVVAEVVHPLGSVEYSAPPFSIDLKLSLMRYVGESSQSHERRQRCWASLTEALRRHHPGAKIGPLLRASQL